MTPALALLALLLSAEAGSSAREGAWRTAQAQTTPEAAPRSWPEEKCVRYRRAWTDLLARRGADSLGRDFVERHEAFLGAGCAGRPDVCPRSQAELDVANILVIAAMNAGLPSTFLPFACRRREP